MVFSMKIKEAMSLVTVIKLGFEHNKANTLDEPLNNQKCNHDDTTLLCLRYNYYIIR